MPSRILTSIRAQTDTLITRTTGLFTTTTTGFDCTDASQVSGFSLSAREPAGTAIYYAFRLGQSGYWFSLDAQGNAQEFASGTLDYETLEASGNTTAELQALTNIPPFVGQNVTLCVGMFTEDITVKKPQLNSIAVNFKTTDQQTSNTQYSPVYELGEGAQVISANANTAITGNASAGITAQLTYSDKTQSQWLPLTQVAGEKAESIQFRAILNVNDINSDIAHMKSAKVIYADGDTPVTGETDTELYSITQDWFMKVHQCRLSVKHAHLDTSTIKAYVALREAPVLVTGEVIGVGSATRKTYQIANINGIKHDSIKIYFDNARAYTGYDINTQVGRITCEAPEGTIISCDYEYGWEKETWQEMMLDSTNQLPEYDLSEYRYAIESNNKTVCAIRLVLHTEIGHTDNYELAPLSGSNTATGNLQTVMLPYMINDGNITLYVNGTELDGKNWEILDEPNYIRFSAPEGSKVTCSYDWVSETPTVYQFAAVFGE